MSRDSCSEVGPLPITGKEGIEDLPPVYLQCQARYGLPYCMVVEGARSSDTLVRKALFLKREPAEKLA